MSTIRSITQKYSHAWVFLYAFIYVPWFFIIENATPASYHMIHSSLDDLIPFCEYFVLPYYIWFPYMLAVFLFVFFVSKEEFYKVATLIIIGMTAFLIFSSLYPNAHELRPETFAHDNIFTKLVAFTYSIDTPTNILPSIHVYNSIGCHIAIAKCERLKGKHLIKGISLLIATLIVLSTVFIKQHSVIDGMLAFALVSVMYACVYIIPWKRLFATRKSA